MATPFNFIPSSLRLPLFWAEVDPSLAGTFENYARACLIAYKTSDGTATADALVRVSSRGQAKTLAGAGSPGWAMFDAWFRNNSFDETWAIFIDEPSGDAATGSIAVTGPATASGVIALYIAGRKTSVRVVSGDSANTIAGKINTAINANTDLPVTSTVSTNTVTVTAKWEGIDTNGIDIRLNYLGTLGAEALPAGVGVTITAMSGGTGVPDLSGAIASLGDQEFDTVVLGGWNDSGTLNAVDEEWDHAGDNGRWSWQRQIYGHVFTSADGSVGTLQTLGASRNGAHVTCFGYYGSPTPRWERAAMYAARAHRSLMADPARPLHGLELTGMLPAVPDLQFTKAERNSLAYDGISTATEGADGKVRIETSFSMYQLNTSGLADNAFLKLQTLATLAYVLRSLRYAIVQKFPRHKLGDDDTKYDPGQPIVTPKVARAEIIAHYRTLERKALVENAAQFKETLVVERDVDNPNRLNVTYGPDLVNQLDVFAVLAQFRLQYPTETPDAVLTLA